MFDIKIRRILDKHEIKTITTHQVSIDNKIFNLDELIATLDDLYYTKNRYEYCEIPKKLKEFLAKHNIIEYHSGGAWKSTNFDKFYKKIYGLI